jgi:hypothetical protein
MKPTITNGVAPPILESMFDDLSELRKAQNFAEIVSVKRIQSVIPVKKKPDKQQYVRVKPDWSLAVAIIEDHEDMDAAYCIAPELLGALVEERTFVTLYLGVTKQGTLFFWRVKRSEEGGRVNTWTESMLEAIDTAKERWVRLLSNREAGGYDLREAQEIFAEPVWPEEPIEELLKRAFRGRVIADLKHPLLRRLQGRE